MNINTTLKATVAAAALFAVAVPVAEAGTVSNSSKMDVSLSGHMNKGMWYYNNGEDSGIYQGDNGGSQTRARIVAKGKINEAMSVTATTEWAMTASNESSLDPFDGVGATTNNGSESGTDSFFTIRHNYLTFAHKQFGTVKIGHTSEATDGITEFGGVGNLQYGTSMLFGGSVSLVNSSTKARATGTDLGEFRTAVDGGRSSAIAYATPSMGGFVATVSHTNEQNSAAEVRFGGKFGGIGVSAGIGYKNVNGSSTTQDAIWGGGIALSHDSGLAADFNYGKQKLVAGAGRTPTAWSVGLNYAADLSSMGKTTFRVAYSKAEDATAKNDEITGYMVGAEQSVADGVAVYAGYQHDSVDQAAGVSYDAVTTVFAGTKVVF